jgi:hypothetical protein
VLVLLLLLLLLPPPPLNPHPAGAVIMHLVHVVAAPLIPSRYQAFVLDSSKYISTIIMATISCSSSGIHYIIVTEFYAPH